jgi:hypothetical protein
MHSLEQTFVSGSIGFICFKTQKLENIHTWNFFLKGFMQEHDSYQAALEKQEKAWESLCIHCGSCCGASDDPCSQLKSDGNGKYFCDTYSTRLGTRQTVSGEVFKCVKIQYVLDKIWKNDHQCIYKQREKMPWLFKKNGEN